MPQVSVTIAGRVYRMACGDGEEEHLRALARMLDERIGTMRNEFGEIGDQRLTVMAAITLADSLAEAHGRIATLEREVADLVGDLRDKERLTATMTEAVAAALDGVTAGLDDVAAVVSQDRPADAPEAV